MEVLLPHPPAFASSHLSVPSSPRTSFAGHPDDCYFYTSAPSSPSRVAAVYADLYGAWDEKPPPAAAVDESSDFSFSFHGPSEGERAAPALASADDLFEGGMIRPSMPAPRGRLNSSSAPEEGLRRDRGRAGPSSSSAAAPPRGRRATRSLSPLRGGGEEDRLSLSSSSPSASAAISVLCKHGESKKWKLKDLFLFRSASEGRATATGSKDPLRKHTFLPSSSSLAESGGGGGGGSEARRRGAAPPANSTTASAHGMYYSANRAASEEKRRKTPLPYQRHGLFGYLRYNPAIHSIKKGLSGPFFSRRQQP